MRPPIVFLDRDGTIMEDTGYVRDPGHVRLLSGAGAAIARLNAAGHPVVVVTNQSGIARGILTEAEYAAVATRMEDLLRAEDARLDYTAWCPHAPEVAPACDCRKPGTGGHRAAALALGRSTDEAWCIGDRLTDLLPAREFGGRGVLVLSGDGHAHETQARSEGFEVAADLPAAVSLILG
ncbi:MAG TPA: HAD-IIIA family hydrolase [Gemmatimonadales bacterium]|nr:HAD-IIIA family hydrolase [Gemmatimonadales bacterium]